MAQPDAYIRISTLNDTTQARRSTEQLGDTLRDALDPDSAEVITEAIGALAAALRGIDTDGVDSVRDGLDGVGNSAITAGDLIKANLISDVVMSGLKRVGAAIKDTGDRISVVDEEENVTVTGNISKITVSGNCSMTVTCGGFGNVSEVVNYNRSSTGQNNQIKAEAAQASAAGAISSYDILSDLSVKINSVTYTIEKNVAGLITKITDSMGNTLKPAISGDITEITLHNAALWGAVMARGIWSSRVNPNLLDNPDFRINQRGQCSYSSEGYTVDRWKQDSRTKVTAEADGIRVECIRSTAEPWAGVAQIAEAPFVMGDSYTISLYVADIRGTWRLRSDNAADGVEINLAAGLNVLTFSVAKLKPGSFSNNGININITAETRVGDYFKLQWAKLETGETATEYTAPKPADELRECQRFYQIHSSGSLSPDELDPPMRATPTVTRLSDGNYAYSADL